MNTICSKLSIFALALHRIACQFTFTNTGNVASVNPDSSGNKAVLVTTGLVTSGTGIGPPTYSFLAGDRSNNFILWSYQVTNGIWTQQSYSTDSSCNNSAPCMPASGIYVPTTTYFLGGTWGYNNSPVVADLVKYDYSSPTLGVDVVTGNTSVSNSNSGYLSMAYLAGNYVLMGGPLQVIDHPSMSQLKKSNTMNNIVLLYLTCLNNNCVASDDHTGKINAYDITQANFLSGGADSVTGSTVDSNDGCIGIAGYSSFNYYLVCSQRKCYPREFGTGNTFMNLAAVSNPLSHSDYGGMQGMTDGAYDYFMLSRAGQLFIGLVTRTTQIKFLGVSTFYIANGDKSNGITMLNNMETITYIEDPWTGKNPTIKIYQRTIVCDTGCSACSPLPSDCSSCLPGYNLTGSTCTSTCPANCSNCSSNTVCTACLATYYLSTTNSTCTACNGDGYFTLGWNCSVCDTNCVACAGTATNCTSCNITQNLYLYSSNHTCGLCPSRPGYSLVSPNCLVCGPHCNTCSGNGYTCLTCLAGNYLYPNATCGSCPATGFYILGSNCAACSANCLNCSGTSASCTACYPGYINDAVTGGCITCPAGQFVSGSACVPCSPSCFTCNMTSTNCTSCHGMTPALFPNNNTCGVCDTSNGYYTSGNVSNITCLPCSSNCKTCSTSNTSCSACKASNYLLPNLTCDPCNGTGQFISGSNCQSCIANCLNCTLMSTHCTACQPGSGFYVSSSNFTCGTCGGSNYVNNSICYPCNLNCATCSNISTNCTSCVLGQYIQPDLTCGPCTSPQIISGSYCLSCSNNCTTCSMNVTNCTGCLGGYYLNSYSTQGSTICDPCTAKGQMIQAGIYCVACATNCLNCWGTTTTCTACKPGFYLDNSTQTCIRCITNCALCQDATTCTICNKGYLLATNSTCITNTSCQQQTGFFINNGSCSPCNSNCLNCSIAATNCTACPTGQALYSNSTCAACTKAGWFEYQRQCFPCDSSCLTCNGTGNNNCLTCLAPRSLTATMNCLVQPSKLIGLTTSAWDQSLVQMVFIFDQSLAPAVGQLSDHSIVMLFSCPLSQLDQQLASLSASLSWTGVTCQQVTDGWKVSSVKISQNRLLVQLTVTSTLTGLTMGVRFDQAAYLIGARDASQFFTPNYLVADKISIVKTSFDQALSAVATPAAASMTTVQLALMGVSIPQAFVLLKIMQTLDYYIYINCDLPTNFQAFLQLITNNALQYIPNAFSFLSDDEGAPLYDRFAEFGQVVHFFINVGPQLTLLSFIALLKLLLWLICNALRYFKKLPKLQKADKYLSLELLYGVFESNHLDFVLAVVIFMAFREGVNDRANGLKYIVIFLVSLWVLGMVSLYLFMGYTIKRLTDCYYRYAVIKVEEMKDEPCRFWLADKEAGGGIFQRHFNLISLMKDVTFTLLLFTLYFYPLILIVLMTLIQVVFAVFIFKYPPFNIPWMNRSLKLTNLLYGVLNLQFLLYVALQKNLSVMLGYYVMGFSMIGVVIGILATNVGFSTYYSIKDLIARCKKNKKLKVKAATMDQSASNNQSFSQDKNDLLSPDIADSSVKEMESQATVSSPPKRADRGKTKIVHPVNEKLKLQTAKPPVEDAGKSQEIEVEASVSAQVPPPQGEVPPRRASKSTIRSRIALLTKGRKPV